MITFADFFAGGGGSSWGATHAGADVVFAVNHWEYAVRTHQANHPGAEHRCADVASIAPASTPRVDVAWFSPSCTAHTIAQGAYRRDEAAELSRSTMWDVVRFTEHHLYPVVLVENVVEVAARWTLWRPWRDALEALGYRLRVLSLNSAHVAVNGPAVAQSRDRLYVVATRRDIPTPDLTAVETPPMYCGACETTVTPWRAWTNPAQVGKWRAGYTYACPTCLGAVEPVLPAGAGVVDFTDLGKPIGPHLAEATRRRISIGQDRYGHAPFIAELRGGGSTARALTEPLCTITAGGRHHMLITRHDARAHYRMLTADELSAGQGFPVEHVWGGTDADKRRAIGNAVSTNVARDLVSAVVASLEAAA